MNILHYAPIAVGLLEMNGDLNKFNETMTTGYKVIDGYNLQMQSMSNQIELAKNNFMALNATAFDSIKVGFLPLIKVFNETSGSLKEMNSILPILSSSLAGLFTYFTILSTSAVVSNIKNFITVFTSANPYIRGIAIAVAGLVSAFSFINKLQTDKLEKIADINKKFENINKNKQEIEGLTNEIKMLNKEYADLAKVSTSNALDRQREIWERYSKAVGNSNDSVTELLKSLKEISEIDPMKSINEEEVLKTKISRLERGKQQAIENSDKIRNTEIADSVYTLNDIDILKNYMDKYSGRLNERGLKTNAPILYKKLQDETKRLSGNKLDYISGDISSDWFGQRVRNITDTALTSPEYANYVTYQEIIAKYDKKLAENKKDLLIIQMENNKKEREALDTSIDLAKGRQTYYGVEDLKNIKTFGEFGTKFYELTGQKLPSFINNPNLKPESTNIDFLKSTEANGYINDIMDARQVIEQTKENKNKDIEKLKNKGITKEDKLATEANIKKADLAIEEWKKVINMAKLNLSQLSKNAVSKATDSLVNVNFKEIKSNIEQLNSEIASMGLTGIKAINAQFAQLETSTKTAEENLNSRLVKLGYNKDVDYNKIIQNYETKYAGKEGEKLASASEQKAYERAVEIEQVLVNLKESGLNFDIKSFNLKKDKVLAENNYKRTLEDESIIQDRIGKTLTQSMEMKDIQLQQSRLESDLKNNLISQEEYGISMDKLRTKEFEIQYKYKQQELETQERIRESVEKIQEMKKEIQDLKSIDWTGTVFEPLTKFKYFNNSMDSINNKNRKQHEDLERQAFKEKMSYSELKTKFNEIDINTELEKTKLAKEQLEYARSMADTLYNAFKSGNIAEGIFGQLGNIGGTIGGGKLGESLFGGIGNALGISGGAIGGFVGQLGGSIVGGFLQDTFFGPDEAHRKNEEYANYLLEQIKELQKANNTILNSAFGQVSTVGTNTALNQVMSKATLTEVEGKYTVHKSGFFGIGSHDKDYTKKLEEERVSSYNDLLAKQADYQNKLNKLGVTYHDKYGNVAFKYYSSQDKADKQAYEQRLKQIDDLIAKTEEYKKYAKDAYAGFEVTFDDITNKVTENWDKTYSQILTDIKNFKSVGSNIGSLMFTGIKDYLIGENSIYNTLLTSISTELKSFFTTDMKNGISTVLIDSMNSLKIEQIDYNNKLNEMVKVWHEAGQSISDIISSTSELTQSVYNGIISAFDSSEFSARFNSISETVSKGFMDKFKKQLLDKSMANTFFEFNQIATDIMNKDTVSLSDAISLRTEMEKVSASMQNESSKTQAIVDLLNMKDVEYTSSSQAIQYSSGSTNTNVYNLNSNITVDVGNMVTMDKGDKQYFANEIGVEVLNVIEAKIGKINK